MNRIKSPVIGSVVTNTIKTTSGYLTTFEYKGTSKKFYVNSYTTSFLTVDIVFYVEESKSFIFITRGNEPYEEQLALVGGFVDTEKGETPLQAACREAQEEIGCHFYEEEMKECGYVANGSRDPRGYVTSFIFLCVIDRDTADNFIPGDDAVNVVEVKLNDIERFDFAFDHIDIVKKVIERI